MQVCVWVNWQTLQHGTTVSHRCQAEWNKGLSRDLSGERLSLTITTEETINMNLTNALLDLCHTVKSTWTQDYYNRDRSVLSGHSVEELSFCHPHLTSLHLS